MEVCEGVGNYELMEGFGVQDAREFVDVEAGPGLGRRISPEFAWLSLRGVSAGMSPDNGGKFIVVIQVFDDARTFESTLQMATQLPDVREVDDVFFLGEWLDDPDQQDQFIFYTMMIFGRQLQVDLHVNATGGAVSLCHPDKMNELAEHLAERISTVQP